MKRTLLAALLLVTGALAALKTYEVVPCSNYVARQTAGLVGVTQCFRNTVDSLTAVWVWVGDTVDTGNFKVEVYDSLTNDLLAQTAGLGVHATNRWYWLICPLYTISGLTPVRGRSYRLTVSRTSGSPIEFAYSPHNPYHFGNAEVNGSTPTLPEGSDAVLRVYGLTRPLDSLWLGANCNFVRLTDASKEKVLDKAKDSLGIGWVREDVTSWNIVEQVKGNWTWWFLDTCRQRYANHGMRVLGLLAYCSSDTGITTQPDTTPNALPYLNPRPAGADKYPPRGLWNPYNPGTEQNPNYWAIYVDSLTSHCGDIGYLECWNEPNSFGEYFGFPDTQFYRDDSGNSINTVRESCSLYVQMCWLAKQIAGPRGRKVIAGSTTGVNWDQPDAGVFSGASWLEAMFSIASGYPGEMRDTSPIFK